MLQAQFQNAAGEMELLDEFSDYPPHLDGVFDTVKSWVSDAAGVASTAVQTGIKAGEAALRLTCGVAQNESVRQGAGMAANLPDPRAQGVAQGVNTANAICSAVGPKPKTAAPVPAAGVQPIKQMKVAKVALPKYPAGTIGAFDPKMARFRIAIPIGAGLRGYGFGYGFGNGLPVPVNPVPADMPLHALLQHDSLKIRAPQKSGNWWAVNTADYPYKATFGLGAAMTHQEVAAEASLPMGVAQVPLSLFNKSTGQTPWFAKPWVWAAIGGGALAVGGGAYYVMRRRRA